MMQEQAELIALEALTFIAEDEQAFIAFLRLSGFDRETLTAAAGDPSVLGSVLDFLLQDEKRLLAFCDSRNMPPDRPARARLSLPGAEYLKNI
ncbi:DUF3572 domain-containing protein [Emcibacter nanhaiensis]|uniref:DUF3572 family protein n=1 Tax=Emcibacter nanhaiensis TaxID=1505037 RepID=A0A501PSY9_9PROT|nr:DUF3572 domain-containing protein [Emcibacter nanhaiensis]TPD63172.1 DUF3572 family protein [Emcibacter nanhaiensis]